MTILRSLATICSISLLPCALWAAELEDFSGGVSNTRVTINPATAGTINRIHIQYNLSGYDTEAERETFLDQIKVNGDEATVMAPDQETPIVAVAYEDGHVGHFNFTFVWPFDSFSIGLEQKNVQERYKNGIFVASDGELLENSENSTGVKAKSHLGTTSYLFGFPTQLFTLGLRFNNRSIRHRVDFFNPGSAQSPEIPLSAVSLPGGGFDLDGDASYDFWDIGLLIPNLLPRVDLGITYRTPVEATMKFEKGEFGSLPSGVTVEDFEFEEPSLTLVGVGYIFEFGISAIQLLGDYGLYSETDRNGNNQSGGNGNRNGRLIRFVLPPLFDISYGIQEETLAGFIFTTTTTSIQFPLPFSDGYTVKLGTRQFKVIDEGDVIVDTTFFLFSFNLQFGERRGRGLDIKPKTKEIKFIDRL